MAIKTQIQTLKENWLIVALVLLVVGMLNTNIFSSLSLGSSPSYDAVAESYGAPESKMALGMADRSFYPSPIYSDNFAPDVATRLITKTAYMENEVKRGDFKEAESELKDILKLSDAFLLSENVAKYDSGVKEYFTGYYNIKVESSKYTQLVSQLKEIGEVKSFSESGEDITGQFTDTKLELEAEKSRLQRYKDMLSEATLTEDKIRLSDLIFNQERTIKYLEDSLKSSEQRVEYSTISFTLREKRSEYADIALVKLGQLVQAFVESINNVLRLLFVILPYAVVAALAWILYRRFSRR